MTAMNSKSLSFALLSIIAVAGCMKEPETEEERYEREKAEALASFECPEGQVQVYEPPHTGCWTAN